MADKKLTLALGGKELVLNLGNNYFYEYFLEETGIDLFEKGLVDTGTIKYLLYAKGFVISGHRAECSSSQKELVMDPVEIRHTIMCMDDKEVNEVFMKCCAARSGKTYEQFMEEVKNAVAQAAEKNGMSKELIS